MSKGRVFFKNKETGWIEKKLDGTFEYANLAGSPAVSWTLPQNENLLENIYSSEELFPFFDGLIPEGWLLNLVEKNWKIQKNDRMALLLSTCHDCIGAAHIENMQVRGVEKSVKINLQQKAITKKYSDRCHVCCLGLADDESLYHKKCAVQLFGFANSSDLDISIDDLDEMALIQINQRLTLAGVQKKLSLSSVKSEKKERLTVVGIDGRFILKPSTEDYPEMAEIEHLSMKIAKLIDIPVADCGLVHLKSGERAYITRRFDRLDGAKIQMEDFCQLSEKSTQQKYTGSSEGLAKIIDKYSSQPQDDKLTLFQIILYSFWIGNADMHLKNFSLWQDPRGQSIRISPGYDFVSTRLLIPSKYDAEELALPVNGRKNKLKWSDFVAFGIHLKIPIKVIDRVREKMLDTFFDAEDLIERSFLSDEKKREFNQLLIERSKRLAG